MRSHAKASSAGSILGRGASLGSSCRAFATRGVLSDADGSGAPFAGWRLAVALSALLAFLVLAPFAAAKVPTGGFAISAPLGSLNLLGGQFSEAFGIAVNNSGVGAAQGTIYVVDSNGTEPSSPNRVQRFSPAGAWERVWGEDVIAAAINEEQVLTVNATGGTYTLSFKGQSTGPIDYNASSSEVLNQLMSLSTIGAGNLTTGSSSLGDPSRGYAYTFIGPFAAADVQQPAVDTSQLSGTAEVSTVVNGHTVPGGASTGFEICTVALDCKAGSHSTTTANGGQLDYATGIALNQANGHVYVNEATSSRISEFDADGNFIRAWGWDVIAPGEPNDTGAGFEVCTVAAECKNGISGANGGEFQFPGAPVLDSSNNVWVPDGGNRRIEEFDSTGHFIAAYGYDVDALGGGGALEKCTSTAAGACQAGASGSGPGQFSGNNPRAVAFDSSGNLYALDAENDRVEKFDPTLLASASTFGASAFAAYTTQAPGHMLAIQGGTRLLFSLDNDVTANPAERQIIEVDPSDESVKDVSLVGAGLSGSNAINGLGADGASGTLFVATGSNTSPHQVLRLGAAPPAPELTMNPIGAKTDSTATLSASVDPKGAWVSCKFQYSTDQSAWTDVAAPGCVSLASGGGAQAISVNIGGLDPNTQYFVRLQVSRPLSPNSTVTSIAKGFTTDAPPPVVSDVGAIDIADRSARIVATIDPRNTETGYVFQYGATPALGSSTAPLNIGSGTTPLTVSQVVGGLSPDTTYYYRVVATNLTGATTTSSHTLHTRAAPLALPQDRHWEQVSPPDKNYGDADSAYGFLRVSVSLTGEGVVFCPSVLFGEPANRMAATCAPYVSRRSASGWQTPNTLPDYCHVDPESGNANGALGVFPSADFSRLLIKKAESAGCSIPPLDPAAPLLPGKPSSNIYLQDPSTDPFSYDLLNPNTAPGPTAQTYAGGSNDFSHVVYQSIANQTAYPGDSPAPGNFSKLYEWDEGALRLVSKDTSNEPFTTRSLVPTIGSIAGASVELASAVSDGGGRIYFENPVPGSENEICNTAGCEIYMREDGAVTHDVSASECTASCGSPQTMADVFLSATPSGEKAFFASCAKLSDDASAQSCAAEGGVSSWDGRYGGTEGSKLYRWDRGGAPGHQLVDLTADHEPSDGTQPGFLGLIGESDDGDTAYFVTRGQIVPGEPTTPVSVSGTGSTFFNNAKLYRWRWNGGSPTVDYLGPYATLLSPHWGDDMNLTQQHRQVSPDGGDLMIYTELALDPAADRDSDADVYRWDKAEGWTCVSCQLPGVPSRGDVDLEDPWNEYFLINTPETGSIEPRIYMSDDGKSIFFGTPDALVPGDVNGEVGCPLDTRAVKAIAANVYTCEDVYEWHDGTVSLISSGTGAEPARLIGSGASGRDVFFFTRQPLVGWDVDDNVDIYDARVGGGFPEPPAQPAECEGAELCHGQGASAPAASGAGTAVFQGAGNPVPKHKGAHKTRKHKKHHKRAAKHNRRTGR